MPWKECHVVDERLRFIARLLDGEKMATVCEEFGISRKTGYKIYERYQHVGVQGLTDRSRRPHRHANQLPHGGGKTDRPTEERIPELGRPETPGASPTALARCRVSGDQHGARRAGPTRPGAATPAPTAPPADGHAADPSGRAECVCGARTIRANSSWPIDATATRSRSPISRAAI